MFLKGAFILCAVAYQNKHTFSSFDVLFTCKNWQCYYFGSFFFNVQRLQRLNSAFMSLQSTKEGILYKYPIAEGSWSMATLQMDTINLYDLIWYIVRCTDKHLKSVGTLFLQCLFALQSFKTVDFLRANCKIFCSAPYFFWTATCSHLVFTQLLHLSCIYSVWQILFCMTNKVCTCIPWIYRVYILLMLGVMLV